MNKKRTKPSAVKVARDTTARKKAAQKIQEARDQYQSLVENIPGIIYRCKFDKDWTMLYLSSEIDSLSGYPTSDFIGNAVRTYESVIHPDDTAFVTESISKAVDEGRTWDIEYRIRHKDGDNRWAHEKGRAVAGEDGSVDHLDGFILDITDRNRAEKALQESEEKYRKVFHTNSDSININRLDDGMYILINDGFTQITGYTEADISGRTSIEINIWENPADRQRLVEGLKRDGVVKNLEANFRKKDGTIIRGLMSASMITMDAIPHIISLTRDITERKRAEELLRESEENYRNIFNNSIEGIFQTTPAGRYRTINQAFAAMFGYGSPEEMIADVTNIGEQLYVNPEDRKRLVVMMEESRGMVRDFEVQLIRKDGSMFWVSINARMVSDEKEGSTFIEGTCMDITSRKLAEDALLVSEEQFRTLSEAAFEAIAIHEEGILINANDQYFKMFGYEPDEAIGKEMISVTFALDSLEIVREKIAKNDVGTYEAIGIRKDGRRFPMEIRVRKMEYKGRNVRIGTILDITERKKTEEELRKSEERHRTILSTAMDGFFVADSAGRLIEVNETYCRMSGYAEHELLRLSVNSVEDVETAAETAAHLQKVMVQGEDRFESRHRRKDGSVFDVEVSVQYRPADEAKLVVFIRDITKLKQADNALRESEARKRSYFEQAPYGVFIANNIGEYMEVNSKACELTGYSEKELTKMSIPDLLISEELEKGIKHFEKVKESGSTYGEYRYRKKDGTIRWWSVAGVNLSNDLLLGFCADITERKTAEVEKSKLEAQLFQSQKMEAIGTLAGGIAHDFNNILSVIIGYAELARDRSQKDNKEQYLQEVLSGAERARNLVKQILTFSRQENREKKPLDIKVMLKEAIKFLRASIPTTIEINQQLTEETCNILADPTQIHQVIMNLCTNAAHAMKETGGTLKIELSNIELGKDEIPNHPELQQGHYVKLSVIDTGHGIDPAIIQSIFDPFFTTKSVDEGTGLGLSVVYGIVKGHGGVVNVYSQPGKGAAFHVYLPLIIQTDTKEVEADKPVIGGAERILFVDDEPALVDIGMRMLFPLGYHVTGAASSKEALDMFRSDPQRFDLVITDMTLPKMTGIDLSREILKIRPDIPIILCSGIKEPKTEAQVKSLGIKAYVTKPLTRRELAHVMRDVLDGGNKR